MKTTLILCAALAAGVSYFELRAQTPGSSSGSKVAYPYGLECILTLDPIAERTIQNSSSQATPSGFQADGTLRGQLIYISDEWCVLKDGSYENWVPRAKVLAMRVSK